MGYKLELKTSVNLIIKTFPSYIRHHQVASVAIFSFFLFQFFFFTYFFFCTWITWKSDCSDFLHSEKLKIGTNTTKSEQLAGMLLKGQSSVLSQFIFRAIPIVIPTPQI